MPVQVHTSSYSTSSVVKPKPAAAKSVKKLTASSTGGLVVHDLTEINVPRGVRTLAATESRDAAIRECRRKVERISRECRQDNVKYRDPHFDLSSSPLDCLRGLKPLPKEEAKPQTAEGDDEEPEEAQVTPGDDDDDEPLPEDSKRIGDLFQDPKFIVDGIDAGDIKQGAVGDCWFLAAVATIANMPTLLESICVARDELVGVYGFIFFRDGEWISEVIDDQLFVANPSYAEAPEGVRRLFGSEKAYVESLQRGSDSLFFAKCADSNETWLPLLEKAFAKAHGDYAAIDGGHTGEGVEDLTGGVTSDIITADILDRDRFWTEELSKVNKELLFACAIMGLATDMVQGLFTNHAYSVLKAIEVNGKRFVKIRNPWGKSEWTGPWSDGSSHWTAEWMTLLEHKFGDDGAFWMTYEDFLATFTILDRTRVFTNEWTVAQVWTQCHVAWPSEFAEQQFSITLSQASAVVIVLQQADQRYFTGLGGQYDFTLHMRVRREGETEYYARSKQAMIMSRSVNKELQLEAGTWIVTFRVSRTPNGQAPRSKVVAKYKAEHSNKFLAVARNFDFAQAKGIATEWIDEVEEEPTAADDEETEAEANQEEDAPKEGEEGAEEDAAQEEEEEEEEDDTQEDTTAVVGIRVHAIDPKLQVELAPRDEAEEEMDPDESSVTAFLSTAADKTLFLSHSYRK